MKKTISFGKHAVASKRKINEVEVTLELMEDYDRRRPVFTAVACAWNARRTDWVRGGQCLDSLAEQCRTLRNNPLYREILGLWRRNHLNDMNAGTERQTQEVGSWLASTGRKYDYDEVCQHLKDVGLYCDNGYEYGSGWCYHEISPEDLGRIRELIGK